MTAPTVDQMITEVRDYAARTVGRGMHIQVPGTHLAAVLAHIDNLQARIDTTPATGNGHHPPEPPWQAPLATVIRVVADIIEDDAYSDLCGTNLLDALYAYAARTGITIDDPTITAVERALSGH